MHVKLHESLQINICIAYGVTLTLQIARQTQASQKDDFRYYQIFV